MELVLAPGMTVDANEVKACCGELAISRPPGEYAPETLLIRLVPRMRHGRVEARWCESAAG